MSHKSYKRGWRLLTIFVCRDDDGDLKAGVTLFAFSLYAHYAQFYQQMRGKYPALSTVLSTLSTFHLDFIHIFYPHPKDLYTNVNGIFPQM